MSIDAGWLFVRRSNNLVIVRSLTLNLSIYTLPANQSDFNFGFPVARSNLGIWEITNKPFHP